MRIISTKTHGVLDYLCGLLFIASPWLFRFATGGTEQWIVIIIGLVIIIMSACTNYELGAIKMIPMSVHLSMDIVAGILLAVSPWLFGFADRVYLPHLIFGLLEIGAGLMTVQRPGKSSVAYTAM